MKYRRYLVHSFSAICLLLLSHTAANAACPAFPYTLTNGTTADAGQVMSNLNSLHTCVDGNGIVNSGTSGQIGTYSSTGSTISGATPSAVLDSSFGSTQGSILYRGASGWTALPPGTTGQGLTSGGTGANPSWVTGPISPFFVSLNTPSAGAFTQVTKTGVTATLGDMASGRGTVMDVLGTGSDSMSSMEQSVLSQTSFTVTTCVFLASSLTNNWFVGVGVKDSSGKYDAFGWRNTTAGVGTFNEFTFSSISAVATTTSVFGAFNQNGPIWLRLQLTGGNFILSASFDGESWETIRTVSATHYLSSTLSSVGIIVDNNSSHHMTIDGLSWSQTTP